MSPTARSLAYARGRGWLAHVVERWVPQARKRIDMFGCIDIVVVANLLEDMEQIIGVQATSGSNHSARVAKALEEPRLHRWCRAGGQFEVWSWALRGKAGTRKTYRLRRTMIVCDPYKPIVTKIEEESCGS
jgi:hypothetical protein